MNVANDLKRRVDISSERIIQDIETMKNLIIDTIKIWNKCIIIFNNDIIKTTKLKIIAWKISELNNKFKKYYNIITEFNHELPKVNWDWQPSFDKPDLDIIPSSPSSLSTSSSLSPSLSTSTTTSTT